MSCISNLQLVLKNIGLIDIFLKMTYVVQEWKAWYQKYN